MAYFTRRNNQRAGLWSRLRSRRLTGRKMAVYGCGFVLLTLAEPESGTFLLGTALVLLGLAIRVWTFGHLEKNQFLTTTGPYAYSRNPAYLGSGCVLLGVILAAGSDDSTAGLAVWLLGVVGMLTFFALYLPRKYRREYHRLSALFPRDYARHAANVPHFWPRMRPWDSGDERRFSWRRVRLNHELIWLPACMVALSTMWL